MTSNQDDANNNEEAYSHHNVNATIPLEQPTNNNTNERLAQIDKLKYFLGTATNDWDSTRQVNAFPLPTGESLSCVFWNDLFHVTGTDIVRCLLYRFHLFGRPVTNLKKFEEGIFSDLRNLKPGMDASLEEPKSEFLEMLYKNNCIRTQKKQKVFFWFSVPHDRLFLDALERDLKREKIGQEPTSVAIAEPATSLSLDTTQDLFDQLRKSMSLSAVAVTHAMDNESNTSTPIISHALTATADDHPISPILPHDFYLNSVRKERHRSTRSVSSIVPDDLPIDNLPVSHSAGASPRLTPIMTNLKIDENSEKQQKIFGAFSLFEGSPTYKQRQRRRTLSSFTPVTIYGDGYHSPSTLDTNNLEITTVNACQAINPHNLFHILRKHQQQQQLLEGNTNLDPNAVHEKVYTCPLPQCARLFKRLEHLKRHFRTHTLERPYSCTMCGKHFSRTDNLAQHKKTHSRGRSSVAVSRSSSIKSTKTSPAPKPSTINTPITESQQQLIIDKLAVLTSNDPMSPTVDYFHGGDQTEGALKGDLHAGPTQSIQQDLVYGNFVSGFDSGSANLFPAPPTLDESGDFCMTEESLMNNNDTMASNMMYDKISSYDDHPFIPPISSTSSGSSLWQSSAIHSSASSISSFQMQYDPPLAYYESPAIYDHQKDHHQLSWYSSSNDFHPSPSPMNPTYHSNLMQNQLYS